jgi:hypothetical protein
MTITATPGSTFTFHPRLWIAAAMLLAFPALGTFMSDEVNWDLRDFATFALMLGALCAGIEAALHFLATPLWRIGGVILAVLMFLTLWAHLAVGIFD